MGKSTPSAPAAPDPVATSAAQTASNVETAQTQAALNRVNQVTPQGSLTYTQPDPNNPNLYTATQTYSPAEQNLFNLSTNAQSLYGNTALAQLGQAAGSLAQPINTNYDDVRNQYINSQMGLIQPTLDKQQQTLQSQLANQGIAQGSTAYQNAQRDFTNQQSSMYANILSGAGNQVGQAIQQQESLRDQPLNEAASLLTGSQVQAPQFTSVPQTQVASTDVLGAYGQAQQANQFAYQQQMANQSATMGGIAGLVGTIGGAAMIGLTGGAAAPLVGAGLAAAGAAASRSDERLKTDIRQVGTLNHPGGDIPIKTFRYRGHPVTHLGFVAQDVEKADPGAVTTHPVSGMKGVNYSRVLMGMGGNPSQFGPTTSGGSVRGE